MQLRISVEFSKSTSVDGLSWPAIFAGTFPDRTFHSLDSVDDDTHIITHTCSPALESLFFKKRPRPAAFAAFIDESLPLLLERDYNVDEEAPDDEELDEDEDDEDEDDEDIDDEEDEEDEPDEEDDEEDEPDEEDNEVYAAQLREYVTALLAYAQEHPTTPVHDTTLDKLTRELEALHLLMTIADESVFDVCWEML